MTDAELTRLSLAVLIQAPFAFRLGFVVRDGREWLSGGLFLLIGSAVAALAAFLAESVPVGIGAALAAVFVLAHARFVAARRPPSAAVSPPVPTPPAAAPSGALQPVAVPDPDPQVSRLLSGMAFLADLLTAADRIGELRHRRRLRKLERQQAERQTGGHLAPEVRRPISRALLVGEKTARHGVRNSGLLQWSGSGPRINSLPSAKLLRGSGPVLR